MGEYWKRVFQRAWRRALELVRVESWERRFILLITIIVPAAATWFFVADNVESTIRALATLGASAFAVLVIFAWSLITLPAVMAAEQQEEIDRLQEAQETAEKAAERRKILGIMLHNANAISSLYRSDTPLDDIVGMADSWLSEMNQFAEANLDEAHQALLWSNTGILIGEPSLPQDRIGRWRWITYRAIRLQEIIKTL